ncbi:MAG: phage portal protein [Oscillospiraceae bacterium]|nr:phage portal protein [Oscillospiraceae bacterium]
MGLFKKKEKMQEIRAAPEERTEQMLEAEGVLEAFFNSIALNRIISREEAMGIPALAGCMEFICGIAASVPVKLYRIGADKEEEIVDDPRLRILNDDTGDLLTGPEWKKAFFMDYFLYGRAWAYQNMELNRLKSLHYVDDEAVSVSMNEDPIFKSAVISVHGRTYYPHQFIHMARNTRNGVRGEGLLEQARMQFALGLNYIEFENAVVRAGGNRRGFLQSKHRLSNDALKELKTSFEKMYGNSYDGVTVLNEGLSWTAAQATSVEMQLAENKERNREEICSLFPLSVSIVTGKASLDEFSQALKINVLPLLDRFDKAINRTLLLESEKDSMHFACDTRDMESGDMLKRYNAYTAACRAGWLSKNEIRYKEKFKPIPGLDVVSMSLGDVVYDINSQKFFVPNTGEAVNMATVETNHQEGGEGNESGS